MKNKYSMALTLAVISAMIVTSLALADNVQNDVVAGGNDTFTAGGSTAVNYRITANNGDGQAGCNAADATPATVTINTPAGVTVDTSGSPGNQITLTFTACGSPQNATFSSSTPGNYNITVSVSDSGTGTYNVNPASFTLHVLPPTNTSPLVSVTGVANGVSYEFGIVPAAGCSVTDAEDGPSSFSATLSTITGPLVTYGLGSQTASCFYTDGGGRTANAAATYSIVDSTAPALTVPADFSVQATSASGAAVTYSASATDAVDPAPVVSCSPASGSTFAFGTTTVNCSATDVAGNSSSDSFDVAVVDTTSPTVTVPSDITAEATGPSGRTVSFSASASDIVDGTLAPTCVPASGTTFALGTTLVTCSATDGHSNTGSASFNVTVVDTTPPTVTVPADFSVEATGPSGAAFTFSTSATDLVDGLVAVSCLPASGSTFALGTTLVTCSATDAHSNTGSASFNVTVQDTTPPTLTLPANMSVSATSATGAVVTFTVSASDLVDGAVTVSCTPTSGSNFAPGTTTVNCSATDAHGNTATGSFTVSVKFQLSGFYQPVDMNSVFNVVKGGSTVPLKFEVFAGSTELTATSVIKSFVQTKVACDGSTPVDDIEFTTTGSTTLRYDTTAGQFIQNWQTPKLPGQCYKVTMTTTDGSFLTAFFKLK